MAWRDLHQNRSSGSLLLSSIFLSADGARIVQDWGRLCHRHRETIVGVFAFGVSGAVSHPCNAGDER